MEVLLARWYWNFFQENRWRFLQRTQVDQAPGDDPLTWDLPRILGEIDRHFSAALAAAEQLRTVPVKDWDGLLQPGTLPDEYRPTLYDFVAKEALEFYQAGEQGGNKAESAFELTADGPVFGTREEFLALEAGGRETAEPLVKAIRLVSGTAALSHAGRTGQSGRRKRTWGGCAWGETRPPEKRGTSVTAWHWPGLSRKTATTRFPHGREPCGRSS